VDPTTGFVDDIIGWNFVANNNRPLDDNGHGTHVAGIIGAEGNNHTGVVGVDPNAILMPLKFMDASGQGSIGAYIAALDYAIHEGAKISNNSWAGGTFTSILYDAIANARAHGVIFVAAAGNASMNIDRNPSYPASYDLSNVVVVASTSRTGALSGFSNYGRGTVDVAAPGEGILSTLPNKQYGQLSGTSMAAPEVSGTLALIWAEHPHWSYTQVINQLLSTVKKDTQLDGKVRTAGIADAATAVGAHNKPGNRGEPTVLSSSASGPQVYTLNRITVTFRKPINPATMKASAIQLIGPSGRLIRITSIKVVAGTHNTRWNLMFATQNTPGTYSLQLSREIRDSQGVALANYYTSFSIPKTSTYADKKHVRIPVHGTATSPINVTLKAQVQSIALKVDIAHANDGNLALYLVAPNGRRVQLAYRLGGRGANYRNTVFWEGASKSIRGARAPFAGTYRPEGSLNALHGVQTLGTWKLEVQDLGRGPAGAILNWSLTITMTNGQTLSVSSSGKSRRASVTEGTEEPGSPARPATVSVASPAAVSVAHPTTLSTTVSGPGVVGMQLVSVLGAGSETPTSPVPATPVVNPGWLVGALTGTPSQQQPSGTQANVRPVEEAATVASDALFGQMEETEVSPVQGQRVASLAAQSSGTGADLDEDLSV
jgi:subtilisin-like proprotein convertase family protein